MKNLILLSQFSKLMVAVLLSKAKLFVSNVLAHSTIFTNPLPTLAAVQDAIDELDAAYADAQVGGKTARLVMQQKRTTLINLLRQLAGYCNVIANGRRDIAAYTQMELLKEPEPVPAIEFVPTPTLVNGIEGSLINSIPSVVGAHIYKHCITDDLTLPKTQWKTSDSTRVKHTFTNLVPGRLYHTCVAVCGINNQCVYSDYATRMAI